MLRLSMHVAHGVHISAHTLCKCVKFVLGNTRIQLPVWRVAKSNIKSAKTATIAIRDNKLFM